MKKIKNMMKKIFKDRSMAVINILLILVAAMIIALVVYGVWKIRQSPGTVDMPSAISDEVPGNSSDEDQNLIKDGTSLKEDEKDTDSEKENLNKDSESNNNSVKEENDNDSDTGTTNNKKSNSSTTNSSGTGKKSPTVPPAHQGTGIMEQAVPIPLGIPHQVEMQEQAARIRERTVMVVPGTLVRLAQVLEQAAMVIATIILWFRRIRDQDPV